MKQVAKSAHGPHQNRINAISSYHSGMIKIYEIRIEIRINTEVIIVSAWMDTCPAQKKKFIVICCVFYSIFIKIKLEYVWTTCDAASIKYEYRRTQIIHTYYRYYYIFRKQKQIFFLIQQSKRRNGAETKRYKERKRDRKTGIEHFQNIFFLCE